MPTRLSIEELRAHIPKLVLNKHVHEEVHGSGPIGRFNTWLAVLVTNSVGSMWCAYVFALLALISLPSVIQQYTQSHDPTQIVAWIAQTFLQLVLLPIIIVGQNVQAAASDARAEADHATLIAIHTLTSQVHDISEQQTAILKLLDERTLVQVGGNQRASGQAGSAA